MRFSVLALDYDGTIARDGILNSEVRTAITEARATGIVVIIVSGRILSDLKQAAGDLQFVDAVVAENGAVLAFPSGRSRLIGHPPPPLFVEELRRRGIEYMAGQCVVEADASSAPRVLAVIRELELPLVLLFNRSRLMVLPQAISKATGLREVLNAFRLSVHNAIAIGDAENDHELLGACEVGVAVSWGSRALQEEAEEVVQGDGPSAVAAYIRQAVKKKTLPPDHLGRRQIMLGVREDGSPLSLAIRGRNGLLAGDPQSGKSWITGLFCEQLILQGYCVCVIDPEGDYVELEALPGVVAFGGEGPPPPLRDLSEALRHPDRSVVVDLSHVPYNEKVDYLNSLLPILASLRQTTGLPHRIVVDEAHYFIHAPNAQQLLDLNSAAYTLVTYRVSELHPELRKALDTVMVKRTTDPHEVRALLAMYGDKNVESEWETVLRGLADNEAILLPGIGEVGGKWQKFKLLPRLTPHVRHRAKYLDVPIAEGKEFVFTDNGKPVETPARTLKELVALMPSSPPEVLDGHARRGDFSRWVADVFHDRPLVSDVRKVEQRYRLGHIRDLYPALAETIQERYEFSPDIMR